MGNFRGQKRQKLIRIWRGNGIGKWKEKGREEG